MKKSLDRFALLFPLVLTYIIHIDSLPDPNELNGLVPTGAGYLQGGLQRENWERAITSSRCIILYLFFPKVHFSFKLIYFFSSIIVTKMTIKKISHPGKK